jgi:hypothetical protein
VYGIQVNAAIAERVRAMVDAARADGLDLASGSGGWRSPEGQIALRRAHCRHQRLRHLPDAVVAVLAAHRHPRHLPARAGLAIDFHCKR